MKSKIRAAAVLPRYGQSLGGGAETLTRELLLKWYQGVFSEAPRLEELQVWTTCAVDHRTWENHHPAGEVCEDGVKVLRFPVDDRDTGAFIGYELRMRDGWPLSIDEQLDWMSQSVNSRGLYEHIARYGREFDYLFFAPYLFATSFWGALIYPEKSVLIPCLHNEHYAYLDVIEYQLHSVAGLLFNTSAEMDLACELYGNASIENKGTEVGMGFESKEPLSCERIKELLEGIKCPGDLSGSDLLHKAFFLYSGRKEEGKNLDLLIDYHQAFRRETGIDIPLVLIGSGKIEFLAELPEGVFDLGFVSEDEKQALFSTARALLQPSTNESFSIVLMEAWLENTPVVVHAGCAVTREHVIKSGGGLYFSNEEECVEVLRQLAVDDDLADRLARSGNLYVRDVYSWSSVGRRFNQALINIESARSESCGAVHQSGAKKEAFAKGESDAAE